MRIKLLIILLCVVFKTEAQNPKSLVPDSPSKAPDYLCTWNIQGYLCSIKDAYAMRMEMQEKNMFGDRTFQNWLDFFPKIRQDIYFVMDDSWDIPNTGTISDYYGMAELDQERFISGNAKIIGVDNGDLFYHGLYQTNEVELEMVKYLYG